MPGVYGFISKNNSRENLKEMADAMHLYNHFSQDEFFFHGQMAASRTHIGVLDENRLTIRLGHKHIWVDGEAYNLSEVASTLQVDASSLERLILVADETGKLDRCLNLLDGYFSAVLYDSNKENLKLISDRYGMRYLYWYYKDGLFCWGSEVKTILAINSVDKSINKKSYDCFLNLGYLLGEETWFDHIKLIKPASIISFDLCSRTVKQKNYWNWKEIKTQDLSFDNAVDEMGERFIEAVSKRFNPNKRIGVSLSGGLDSRAIVAAVDYLYPNYKGYSYTFGARNSNEVLIANRVAKNLKNWEHEIFNFTPYNWFESRKPKVWDTDGQLDLKHMHGSEFLSDVRSKIDINLNGYCGDIVLGGGFLSKRFLNKRIDKEDAKSVYGEYTPLADINNDFYNIDSIEPNFLMNRFRRFTGCGTINLLPWVGQRKPFFDNKLLEFVYGLPDEYRLNNKIYAKMLLKYFPKYFDEIPWQKTGMTINMPRRITSANTILLKFINKCKKTLGLKSTYEYVDYQSWIKEENIKNELIQLFENDSAFYKSFSDKNLVESLIMPHIKNSLTDNSDKILRAATAEIYFKKIYDLHL